MVVVLTENDKAQDKLPEATFNLLDSSNKSNKLYLFEYLSTKTVSQDKLISNEGQMSPAND